MHEIPSHSSKFGVRSSLSRKQIVKPSFFEETINVENYPRLLIQYIFLSEDNERNWWFQQDGEIAHTSKTTAFLQEFFGDRIMGRGFGHHDHQTLRYLTTFCVDFLNN